MKTLVAVLQGLPESMREWLHGCAEQRRADADDWIRQQYVNEIPYMDPSALAEWRQWLEQKVATSRAIADFQDALAGRPTPRREPLP